MASSELTTSRSVNNDLLSRSFQNKMTVPLGSSLSRIQPKGSAIFDNRLNILYVSDGTIWSPVLSLTAAGVPKSNVNGMIYEQGADHPVDPTGTTTGLIWVRSDGPPNILVYTDNSGVDHDLTGAASVETLAQTLVAGNATGGTDIDVTAGDSITSTGQLPLLSSQAAADAVRVNASNLAGGIDVDAGTGGIAVDTTGALSLDAAAASNVTTSVGTLTLASTEAGAGGVVSIDSSGTGVAAVDINSAGGVTVDYAAASTATVTSGGTVISTFGTAAAPNLTVNNGNLSFATATRGIVSGPTNGTVAADAVTVNGTAGVITDSGTIAAGASRTTITVTNSAVQATSQIFIQVSGGATAAQSAALLVDVNGLGVGTFSLDVENTDGANPTTGTPAYHYLIVNPV